MILENNRLKVTVAEPGTVYKRSRFDWSGFITQVELDQKHTFCVPESLTEGSGTGGIGLCNEFGLISPIGYNDTKPLDWFPKIGIGNLQKVEDGGRYNIMCEYPRNEAKIQWEKLDSGLYFHVHPIDCGGFSFDLQKNISIKDTGLFIDYTLKNTGLKEVHTHEYIHNFLGIDNNLLSSDYKLYLPFNTEGLFDHEDVMTVKSYMSFKNPPKPPFYMRVDNPGIKAGEERFKLVHEKSGVAITEKGDFEVAVIAIWGFYHVISPEIFIAVDLAPGETMKWRREYSFSIV